MSQLSTSTFSSGNFGTGGGVFLAPVPISLGVINHDVTFLPDPGTKVIPDTMEDLVIFLLGFMIGPHPQAPKLPIPVVGDTGVAGDPDFDDPCFAELKPALSPNFPGFSGVDATDVEKRGVGTCESGH